MNIEEWITASGISIHSSHQTKAEFSHCFIIHSKYFNKFLTSLPPRKLSLQRLAIFRHGFRIQKLLKN